jgi:hypothetical protein
VRRRAPASRALRLRPRWPWVIVWSAGVAAGVGALAGLAFLSGREQPQASGNFFDSLLATASRPAVAVVLALAALTLTAYCFRHLWLELLAYLPGRIEVPDFEAGAELEADPAQLTMRFRRRLAVSHLQSLSPVPATSAQGDFLDVLGHGRIDAGNVLNSLLTLLRAATPPHAYEVKGVLMRRSGSQSYGVTLQVTRLPRDAIRVETLWDTSWVRVLRRAADHATAAILTRTRRCEAPWAAWRRYPMPGELFHDYERAAELEDARRYDEALDRYYRALERDPLNIGLRLQIGFLQEKIGLPLDALATYEGMGAVARPGGRPLPHRLYRNRSRLEREATMIIGRYRRAVLLAQAELAIQWRRTGPADTAAWTRRDDQRRALRRRLEPALSRLFEQISDADRTGRLAPAKLLREPRPGAATATSDRELLELQELLQLAACREVRRLGEEVGGRRSSRGTTLTSTAAELSESCMQQRLAWTQAALSAEPDVVAHPTAADVRRRLERGRPGRRFDNWPELYNAACAYALPLIPQPQEQTEADERRRTELAEAAVKHLEQAMGRVDSAYVAGRRNWLISEDPDLDGLRSHVSFKHFEAMYFPSPRATPQRPRDLHQWELSRYTHDLLAATAWRWEECWHERGRRLDTHPDLHEMLEWWADEAGAWERVQEVARHHRHWRARDELVADMQGWSAKYGLEALAVCYPRYTDDSDDNAEAAERTVAARDRRLKRLDACIARVEREKQQACSLLADIRRWQSELRQFDVGGQRARRRQVARLCDAHAALWGSLHEWLEAPPGADGHAAFEDAIAHTAALWRAADLRYRTGDALREVPWLLRAGSERDAGVHRGGIAERQPPRR